jgi:hypothetical protein
VKSKQYLSICHVSTCCGWFTNEQAVVLLSDIGIKKNMGMGPDKAQNQE